MTLDPKSYIARKKPQTPEPNEFTFAKDYSYTTPQNDDASSVITLEDDLSRANISSASERLYDLPTHISSHHDVLQETSRTQPTTPVSTPYQEQPNHPLRALTSTHLVLNHQFGTDESLLSSSPVVSSALRRAITDSEGEEDSIQERQGENDIYENYDVNTNRDNDYDDDDDDSIDEEVEILRNRQDKWAEKGAAKLIKRTKNEVTGEEEEIVIRRSVKDFKLGKTLGVGSYSTVILATDKNTGKKFAVKVLDKRHIIREKKVKYVNIEKNTLNRLGKHDGIIHLFFTFQDESSLYFVLDFASNGELLNLIKEHGTLNEDTTKYYAAQILDAIKYMHDNGVVHRDLKPENILLDENWKIQITDFGTAKLLDKNEKGRYPSDTRAKSFVGTAEYVSPELLNERAIGKSCDIWAFGCIAYQMIAGKPPFKATNEYLTFQKIVKLQYAFTAGFPMVIRDLIKRVLVLNPKDRLTVKEIQQHHFFSDIDFANPKESVWDPTPPEASPYKVSAKSMLPVPELSKDKIKTVINTPRRITSSPAASSTSIQKLDSGSEENISESPQQSTSSTRLTASQQVLLKAKATVAARKKVEDSRRISGSGNAANAATIALSRQPNDIIKSFNNSKKDESKGKKDNIATATITVSPPTTDPYKAKEKRVHTTPSYLTTLRKKASTSASSPVEPPAPMTKLDLQFVDYLKTSHERILKKGDLNVSLTTVDTIEKRYKGRIVDSPLTGGSSKSNSSSLLSQVANGSYRGLRNMDQYGVDNEKTIIKNHTPEIPTDKSETTKSKFKKFFGSNSTDEDRRNKLVVLTSTGRALIFNQNSESERTDLKTEIDLFHPVIRIKELIQTSTSTSTPGLFVVESYTSAFVFEAPQREISAWTEAISKAKASETAKIVEESLQKDPSGDAGTVLGSDAAKSAANIATVTSPTLRPTEFKKRVSSEPKVASKHHHNGGSIDKSDTTGNSSSSLNSSTNKNSMLKDLVRSRGSNNQRNTSGSGVKELPGNGQLYHGLPIKYTQTQSSTSSEGNVSRKNPLIAAAEAAISHQRLSSSGSPSTAEVRTSSFGDRVHIQVPGLPQASVPRVITGMNSRLLARSGDRKKKR